MAGAGACAAASARPATADPRQGPFPLPLAGRNLSVVCLVLFVLFGTIVLGHLFPLAIASPLWQLRVSLALINAAPIPLAALALLHLAAVLDPEDPVLQQRPDRPYRAGRAQTGRPAPGRCPCPQQR